MWAVILDETPALGSTHDADAVLMFSKMYWKQSFNYEISTADSSAYFCLMKNISCWILSFVLCASYHLFDRGTHPVLQGHLIIWLTRAHILCITGAPHHLIDKDTHPLCYRGTPPSHWQGHPSSVLEEHSPICLTEAQHHSLRMQTNTSSVICCPSQ